MEIDPTMFGINRYTIAAAVITIGILVLNFWPFGQVWPM